jgi:SAM-dependent methyltransferase
MKISTALSILPYLASLGIQPLNAQERDCAEVFSSYYEDRIWGVAEDGDPSSGWGSFPQYAKPYMDYLVNFIQTNQIHSVVDLGCGSWEFSRYIDWSNVNYIGVDAAQSMIELDQMKLGSDNITFIHGDILTMDLPEGELMVCKDVLQHLQNADIATFLSRIGKYRHCLITNDLAISKTDSMELTESNRENRERGENRPLDLTKPPFNVKGSKVLNYPNGDHIKQVLYIRNDY